jgi:outer membrane protein assembly factor BamB
MEIAKNKAKAILVALFLTLTIAITLVASPAANAHDPIWKISSFAYIAAQPDPVGVGQPVYVYMWVDTPLPNSAAANDIRRTNYKLTITKPDGKTETHDWPIIQDTTGVQYFSFTPEQVGTYTLKFDYAGQTYTWSGAYQNDEFLADSASKTITVQEESLPEPIRSYALPTEYWTRPIEGQNTDWFSISSNWLNPPFIRIGDSGTQGAVSACDTQGGYGRFQPDGLGPNSPHIMWTKSIADGGVVGGGSLYDVEGKTYYMGGSYNVRFTEAIVMHGRLSYQEPWGNAGSGGDYVCVDLRTGEELWRIDVTGAGWVGKPVYGYLYSYDTMNQHGIVPNGWLFTFNYARAYDPMTGRVSDLNLTNVPTGTAVAGPQGEVLRYEWNSAGKWLAQWNSSLVITTQTSGNIPANCPITPARPANQYWNGSTWVSNTVRTAQGYASVTTPAYDWNVTLSSLGPGAWTVNRHIVSGNVLLLTQGSFGSPREQGTGVNITAISLKPDSIGQIMWTKYYPVAPNNETRKLMAIDADAGIFVFQDKESLRLTGFSLATGNQVWMVEPDDAAWDTMRSTSLAAYGNLYVSGFDGVLHCYDISNGTLLWTYGNGGPGNSTYAGLETAWGHYPIFVDVIADGKVYLGTTEHSPDSPFYKNAQYRCVDAYTGEELWTLMGWGTGMYVGQSDIVADGFFVFLNCYDMKIYCVGKGPSKTAVSIQNDVTTHGKKVLVQGSVIDIAAGTGQAEQAARFPNGVPAVSDASQGVWMEYVYMQKPKPTNVTGVQVIVSVLDPNGNCYEVGRATSDASGFFKLTFEPLVPGEYTVIASFAGSESYWPSQAETAIYVEEAPAATPEPTPTPASVADLYLVPGIIAIIAAIAVVGLVIILMLRKR